MRADVRLVQRRRVQHGTDALDRPADDRAVLHRADHVRVGRGQHVEADDLVLAARTQ